LLDNITLQQYEIDDFLGVADKAPHSINIKGGGAWCHTRFVAVTSVDSPKDLLERRFANGNRNVTWGEVSRRINRLFLCFGPQYQNRQFLSSRCEEVFIDITGVEAAEYIHNALQE
jgi:hypothetical protein